MPDMEIDRIIGIYSENLKMKEARIVGQRMQLLFEYADDKGMDAAIKRYGQDLSDEDKKVLKSLKPDELKTMFEIRAKIHDIAPFADDNNNNIY